MLVFPHTSLLERLCALECILWPLLYAKRIGFLDHFLLFCHVIDVGATSPWSAWSFYWISWQRMERMILWNIALLLIGAWLSMSSSASHAPPREIA
jgi:hypothetical protein